MVVALWLALCLYQAGNAPPPPDENPFAVNDAMKEFLDRNIDRSADTLQQLRTLVHMVFEQNALHFKYQPVTRTAIGTFENHGGNCVSFTFLLIAMARYLGISCTPRSG